MKEIENSDIKDKITDIIIDLIINEINNLKVWYKKKNRV